MSNDTSTPAAGLDRRGLLCAVGGVAAAGALPTQALCATAAITPTQEFHEIAKLAAKTRRLWDMSLTREGEERREAMVDELEEPMHRIEARLASEPNTLSDLLTLAALVLYKSQAGPHGFNDPVRNLMEIAEHEDYWVAPGCLLAAAVFELAGMGGVDA